MAGPDLSQLTAAADFANVVVGVLTVFAGLASAYVVVLGTSEVLQAIRGRALEAEDMAEFRRRGWTREELSDMGFSDRVLDRNGW